MAQRLKGQECQIVCTNAGVIEDSFDAIMSFNIEPEGEVKSQGYLGEKTNRKDDVYNGVKFDMEIHISKQDVFRFADAVKKRQKRETPDVVFNIATVMSFPNGDQPTLTIPDVSFGPIPTNIGGRTEYVKVKIQGEASDYEVLYS